MKQLRHIEDLLIESILEATDEEIFAEFSEEFDNVEEELKHVRDLIKNTVFDCNKAKFEAAKKARLQAKNKPELKINSFSLERKKAILRAVSSNDNTGARITLAARLETNPSESDLDRDLECLMELGIIDEQGNLICEDD